MFKGKNRKMIFNIKVGTGHEGLRLKMNKFDVFTVENLISVEVESLEEVLHLFHFGIKNKAMGAHKMNMTSSRSHTIFAITVEQIEATNPDNTIISKLQIVDLAGSERQMQTLSTGEMQREAIEINKSLFTLRKVITALTAKHEQQYIPYRDSKLTCLLRQSLGGNSMCCMIACLQPGDVNFEENKCTLEYAALAA